jgi:leucyl-tRNA synthetase family protein
MTQPANHASSASHASSAASDTPPFRYGSALADQIELRWQDQWSSRHAYKVLNPGEQGFDPAKPKYYVLDMFPYPSGAGLHVGHPLGYTATDILSRFKRMQGFNVLHPMGWDAFGLPAEQYAIQTGIHPAETTRKSIDTFRRQLSRFGFSYDWSREFGTIDPEYYRWTQWIFLKLYHAWFDPKTNRARPIADLVQLASQGQIATPAPWNQMSPSERDSFLDNHRLAYLSQQTVNWCPKLGTVLANDEVIDGRSERGGHPVLRKPLKQWVFRITAYADRLLQGLENIDWSESTKTTQREWIGKSQGAEIDFDLQVRRLSEPTSSPSPFDSPSTPAVRSSTFVSKNPYPPGDASPSDLLVAIRSLPHVQVPGATYFVTWNTKGSLPLSHAARDQVMKSLLHFDGDRCEVYAACVMPNHVHWLVRPADGHELGDLVSSVKRFSATQINALESLSGPVWQEDGFDHVVRDRDWFSRFAAYIARNPIEAKLAAHAAEYPWTFISPSLTTDSGTSLGLGQNWSEEPVDVGSESRPTTGPLRVFTTRPDTLFGATYMVVAPEHNLCQEILDGSIAVDATTRAALAAYVAQARNRSDVERQESKDKTGVFTGVHAINPVTNTKIPVWAADYVLTGYGTGAIMAVPAHDERDWEFAKKFNLPIIPVLLPPSGQPPKEGECFAGDGIATNSSSAQLSLDGLPTAEAKSKIIDWLESTNRGLRKTNFKLRDWVFSRQRYWGEPFPIVYDQSGKPYPVMDSALPVKLPDLADYAPVESDDPQPLLAKATAWMNTTAGQAGVDPALLAPDTPVRRETNTMPGSAGSSWYAIRYTDPKNNARFASREAESYWMKGGVDFYLGGSEHAVGHLLYSRFWHNVLFDLGELSSPEPFNKLYHQGMVTSFAYQRADKTLVAADLVHEIAEGQFVETATNQPVSTIVAKMSKSLKNVINPDDVIAEFGADTFRLYEMYMGPLDASKPWNPRDIVGCFRFLQRTWRLLVDEHTGQLRLAETPSTDAEKLLHRATAKVGQDIERLACNTAIAALIELVNALTTASQNAPVLSKTQVERLALILSPMVPHFAEELWRKLGHEDLIVHAPWPTVDQSLLRDSEVEIPVQIQGKIKARLMLSVDLKPAEVEALVRADPKVIEALAGREPKKIIIVPGKMVNIVI